MSDTRSDIVLPAGLRVGAGLTLGERGAVRIDVTLAGSNTPAAIVLPPHQARSVARVLLEQEDRRVRILGALLLRQADLAEGNAPHLRLVD